MTFDFVESTIEKKDYSFLRENDCGILDFCSSTAPFLPCFGDISIKHFFVMSLDFKALLMVLIKRIWNDQKSFPFGDDRKGFL